MKAVLFTGQGSQYTGMGKEFFHQYAIVRQTFEEASDILGIDMARLCFHSDHNELCRTELQQPALLTIGIAIYRLYREIVNEEPQFMAGHSLGEIIALACAEAIKFHDALSIVKTRGELMAYAAERQAGSMLAIWDMPLDLIEAKCSEWNNTNLCLETACINSERQIVVSGHKEAIENFQQEVEKYGVRTRLLPVNAPFHCSIMKTIYSDFLEILNTYEYMEPKYTVISNLTGRPYPSAHAIPSYLCEQLIKPVLWKQVMDYFIERGVKEAVEIGARPTLIKLFHEDFRIYKRLHFSFALEKIEAFARKKRSSVRNLLNDIIRHAVSCRNNNESVDSNPELIRIYDELRQLREVVEGINNERQFRGIIEKSFSLLNDMFYYKKLDEEEKRERIGDIIRNMEDEENRYVS